MKMLMISIVALVLMVGCGSEPHTKEYYSKHIKEAKARVAECIKLGAMKENGRIDCENAKLAVNEVIEKSNAPIIGDEKQNWSWGDL